MRKLISLILAISLIFGISIISYGADDVILFYDDVEGGTIGQLPLSYNNINNLQNDKWSWTANTTVSEASTLVDTDPLDSSNKVIKSHTLSNNVIMIHTLLSKTVDLRNQTTIIETRFLMPQAQPLNSTNCKAFITLADNDNAKYGYFQPEDGNAATAGETDHRDLIHLNQNNKIYAGANNNYGAGFTDTGASITRDVWMDILLKLTPQIGSGTNDTPENVLLDVYINNNKTASVVVPLGNIPLYEASSGKYASLKFGVEAPKAAVLGDSGIDVYWDEIKITKYGDLTAAMTETSNLTPDRSINFSLNHKIDPNSLDSIAVTKSGQSENLFYNAFITDNKVTVNFVEMLDFSSEYTVDLSGLRDYYDQSKIANNLVFTTREAGFDIKNAKIVQNDIEYTELQNGDVVLTLDIKNELPVEKDIIYIGLLYVDNELKSAKQNKTKIPAFGNQGHDTKLELDFTIPQNGNAVLKMLVWDNYQNINSLFNMVTFTK